jgi:hypothetical protein
LILQVVGASACDHGALPFTAGQREEAAATMSSCALGPSLFVAIALMWLVGMHVSYMDTYWEAFTFYRCLGTLIHN